MIRKTLVTLFAAILAFLALRAPVYASSLGIRFIGDTVFFGNETSVSLQIFGSASAGGDCGGVCGVTANLSYDTTKIELISEVPSQGFDYLAGSTVVLAKSTAATDGTILTYTFRNLGLGSGESTIISFTNIKVSNANEDLSVPSTSISLMYQAPAPQPQQESQQESISVTPSVPVEKQQSSEVNQPEENIPENSNNSDNSNNSVIATEEVSVEDDLADGTNDKISIDWAKLTIWILSCLLVLSLALNIYLLFFRKKEQFSKR